MAKYIYYKTPDGQEVRKAVCNICESRYDSMEDAKACEKRDRKELDEIAKQKRQRREEIYKILYEIKLKQKKGAK